MFWTILGVLAVPLLVLVNAMFVAAEFSLVSVRRTRVEETDQGPPRRLGGGARRRSTIWTTRSPPPSWASRWPAWAWAGSANPASLERARAAAGVHAGRLVG